MKTTSIIHWTLRIVAAIILLQSLYFKFSAAPESVYIFTRAGIEPQGRIATGALELIAAILLLIPRTALGGAVLGLGIMNVALLTHAMILGIEVQGDRGLLFALACAVWVCCFGVLLINREKLRDFSKRMNRKRIRKS